MNTVFKPQSIDTGAGKAGKPNFEMKIDEFLQKCFLISEEIKDNA